MCQQLKALIYIIFKFLCVFHLYNAFFCCVSFRNLETGFSKRHKEYVLIKCLQSIRGTLFHIVNSSILHTQQICSHFRYTINHIHKALGTLPSLVVIHEEIKSSKAGTATRVVAAEGIRGHTNPKYNIMDTFSSLAQY